MDTTTRTIETINLTDTTHPHTKRPWREESLVPLVPNQSREQLFQGLVARTWQRAYWTAYDILGDAAEAEDLCQDALLRAYERWDEFREEAAPDTWVYRILVNLCLNHRRRRGIWHRISQTLRRQAEPPGAWTNNHGMGHPEKQLRDQQTIDSIHKGMQLLSEKQRAIFALRYLQGFSLREAADISGMAIGTAKSHLFRALKTMRAHLSDGDGALWETDSI